MERHAVDDQCGNGLDAGCFGLADARFVIAEMHHVHLVLVGVERIDELLFS